MRPRPAPFDSGCTDEAWGAIFSRNAAPLAIVEPSGQFSAVNDAFSELLGRGSAELVRKSWMSVTHPDDIASDADMVRLCVDGGSEGYVLEKRYLTPSGDVVFARIFVRSVRMYGRLACFVVHAQRLEKPSVVMSEPAPVVMRPKMDWVDMARDNPKQTLAAVGAVILAVAKFLSERNDMQTKLDELLKEKQHREETLQKRTDLETLRRELGNGFGDREKGSPH